MKPAPEADWLDSRWRTPVSKCQWKLRAICSIHNPYLTIKRLWKRNNYILIKYVWIKLIHSNILIKLNPGLDLDPDLKLCLFTTSWSKALISPLRLGDELFMMTSSKGNISRVTGHFVRGIHRSPVKSPHKGQWRGALMFSSICAWINSWVKNGETGDLRRHRAHYDVIVMILKQTSC